MAIDARRSAGGRCGVTSWIILVKSVAFRGGGFAPKSRRWVGVLVFVALILFVEWGTRAGWISSLSLPRPSDVLDTFRQLYDSGLLFEHLLPSLTRLFFGALIGASIGIAVGIMNRSVFLCALWPCAACGCNLSNS